MKDVAHTVLRESFKTRKTKQTNLVLLTTNVLLRKQTFRIKYILNYDLGPTMYMYMYSLAYTYM